MKKKLIFITLSLLFSFLSTAGAEEISGFLKNGLRYINLDDSLNITVYRGDYIVLESSRGGSTISIPSMDIEGELPLRIDGKAYIKMKTSGSFDFVFDNKHGVIDVIDLKVGNYSEVAIKDAITLIEAIEPVIIDVRTNREYASGHIEGALLLPVQELSERIDEIMKYKDEPVFLYCRSGNRSTVAAKMLIDSGFSQVYNLRRGFSAWVKSGYPYEQ